MKKERYSILGLLAPSKTGGLLYCKLCEKIVGSINKSSYRFLKINLICTCGNYGMIEIAHKTADSDIYSFANKMPDFKNNLASCKKCGIPIFGVVEERVGNYSFYAECKCGARYDTRPTEHKRLGETAMRLKYEKKKTYEHSS